MPSRHTRSLLILLARFNPALWDLIYPMGPVGPNASVLTQASELNPQPLPPVAELGFAARTIATAHANAIIGAHLAGADTERAFSDAMEGWCPTGKPFHLPHLYWPWPVPPGPGEPYPIEFALPAVQAQAAMVFEAFASGAPRSPLSESFARLAERLADAAVEGAATVGQGELGSV